MSADWNNIENYLNNQLKVVANRCREILEDTIESEVYDKYQPKTYDRTFQLLHNVRADIHNGYLYVYVNTGNMKYKSNNRQGEDVTAWIPYWINYGHNVSGASDGAYFMYNYYPSRRFIQKAKERIEEELGLQVEIIDNGAMV